MFSILNGGPLPRHLVWLTLPEMLQRAASLSSEGCLYVTNSERETYLSYAALYKDARSIAAGLTRSGFRPGQTIILQFPAPLDFLRAFWACQLGGFVPVPMAPSIQGNPDHLTSRRLRYAVQSLNPACVLTRTSFLPVLDTVLQQKCTVRTEEDLQIGASFEECYRPRLDDLAALLLTSGSTGNPKFVSLSHRNLFGSIAGCAHFLEFNPKDISLNWLPFHHVSALMRTLRDTYVGCRQLHGETGDVLADPLRWLDWIDRHRVTTTWAPTFAFALVTTSLDRPGQRSWKLDCLRSIVVTGEPVSKKAIEAFRERMKPSKLHNDAIHVSWGMTEACFSVCSRTIVSDDQNQRFVAVGAPIPGVSIRVVNEQDETVEEGTDGKVQVRGCHVTTGYIGDPDRNRESFTADGWLRTGDIGLIRNGTLSITGREKDILIVHGAKYAIHEIEAIVEGIDGVDPLHVCVCPIHNEKIASESFVVFFRPFPENNRQLGEVIRRIQTSIHAHTGIVPQFVIPLNAADFPRSSAGKILRAELRDQFSTGMYQSLLDHVERLIRASSEQIEREMDSLERKIAHCFCEILKLEAVMGNQSFFSLGGNSVFAVALAARISELIPDRTCSPIAIFQHPTVYDLAAYLRRNENVLQNEVSAGVKRAELRKLRRYRRFPVEGAS